MASPQRVSLLPGAENHRHGRVSGDDGLTKIVRTFHARFGSVKMGAAVTARERLAYVHREGKHAKDAADVEAAAGDKEKVIEAADRIRDTARVRRGKTAERLLATQVIELPLESTAEQRQACADAFVADWRERGHQAVAVVHVHGEEHKQPHLHVEIAARPVGADGAVDRAATRLWAGGHPAVEVKKERARAADLVNRTCDPDPPYHPGGFRDIGVERQPRTRIPAGRFREAREEIREARAANDTDEAARIEAKAYAVSDQERGGKRDARVARTAEIIEFKAAGLPARPSQRARLERRADKAEANVATLTDEKREAETRAEKAEASVTALTGEKQEAETRADTAQADAAGWEKNTLEIVKLAYEQDGRDLPDLGTDAGLDAAAEFLEGGAGRAEAVAAVRAEEQEEAAKERKALETERDNAKNETSALRAHSAEQTEFLTGVHRESRRDLPDLETGEGRSEAWAFARAVMKAGREAAAEKKELEQRAAPEQLQQPADEALRYFTAAEREAAETRQRKAEAKKAKRGEQSEKEKADGEISEACKPVYRMWKQTGDKIGRALADGGGLAAAAEAYGQYHGSPLSLRKDATEEKLAGVLAAINAAAARLGAEPLKRPLTVEEAAAEYEQRRPKTNAERLAASGAAALAAEEEERLRPAKELAAEIGGEGELEPGLEIARSSVWKIATANPASAASPTAEAGRRKAAEGPGPARAALEGPER